MLIEMKNEKLALISNQLNYLSVTDTRCCNCSRTL